MSNATDTSYQVWPVAADPVIAYAEWRMSCTSVWAAYQQWSNAPKVDADLAHTAYTAALDREDAAARMYSRLTKAGTERDRAAWTWLGRQLPTASISRSPTMSELALAYETEAD